jgi:Protein of unknown function (DUF4058)
MPFHDWNDLNGWEGMHHLWIAELLHWIKPRLPEGFRAYIGSTPALTVGATDRSPDVSVRRWLPEPGSELNLALPLADSEPSELPEPDEEVATLTLDPQTAIYIATQNRMIAALELISPRNKDRLSARNYYLARYLGYLKEGAHLLLIDVHRRPLNFSFADALGQELQIQQRVCPAPFVASYRVGEKAASGGRMIAIWRRPLVVGQPLPKMPLPITVEVSLLVDLESTYSRAAADAYLT